MHDLAVLQAKMNSNTGDAPSVRAMSDVAAYLGVVQGLATGALVFSVGLLTAPITLGFSLHFLLILAWLALIASIGLGILARGAVVGELNNASPNITSAAVIFTTVPAVVSFFAGSLLLGVVLIRTLANAPDVQTCAVQSAQTALNRAEVYLTDSERRQIVQVGAVELIKGLDSNTPRNATWHVRFELAPTKATGAARPPLEPNVKSRSVDVFIDAASGHLSGFP